MVLTAPPVFAAVEALRAEAGAPAPHVVFLSPQGRRFDAALAKELAARPRVALVCGRYEGIDERAAEILEPEEVSVGDYVLSGGEAAALVVLDATARLVPGVLGDERSPKEDSFSGPAGVLDHPHYTQPRSVEGHEVPEVLRSGDHAAIQAWRRSRALERTRLRRPDLLPGEEGACSPES